MTTQRDRVYKVLKDILDTQKKLSTDEKEQFLRWFELKDTEPDINDMDQSSLFNWFVDTYNEVNNLGVLDPIEIAYWLGITYPGDTVGRINAIEIDTTNNLIYFGGTFTRIGGVTALNVAVFDINTQKFSSLGNTDSSTIQCLLKSGSNLFTGSVDGVRKYDGTWTTVGATPGGIIYSMSLSGGDLFACGNFTTIDGSAIKMVARYTIGTDTWTSTGMGVTVTGSASTSISCSTVSGDYLYVGTNTTILGGSEHVWKYQISGNSWGKLDGGASIIIPDNVYALLVSGGLLYIGGDAFYKYNLSTNAKTLVITYSSFDYISCMAINADRLWMGGTFGTNFIQYYNTANNSFHPSSTFDDDVLCLAFLSNTFLFAGGLFDTVNGNDHPMLAVYFP